MTIMKNRLLILACLFLTASVQAFVRESWRPDGSMPGLRWVQTRSPEAIFQDGCITYRLITAGIHAIPDAACRQAIANAFQSWEDVDTAALAFQRGDDIGLEADTDFSVGWTDSSGNTQWGGNIAGVLGLCSYSYFDEGSPYAFGDADIAFNRNEEWSTDASTSQDVEATAVHEIGHSLGLGHSPHAQAVMSYIGGWGGEHLDCTQERRLSPDDRLGASVIYPAPGFSESTGTIKGTITQETDNVHQAQIGVFDQAGILVTTTLSYQGRYEAAGLPPGTYALRAFPSPDSARFGLNQDAHFLPWSSETPTEFLATDDDDATGVVVSAAAATTRNLAVRNGAPATRLRFSERRQADGSWAARTQVLRLKRGESATIGIVADTSTSLPASFQELAELSLSSTGVAIDNIRFSGDAGVPDFGGQDNIVFDVSVQADAPLGDRALFLRDTNYTGQRHLVFGFVEVFAESHVMVGPGPQNPEAADVAPNEVGRPVLQFEVAGDAADKLRLRGLNLSHSGSGDPAKISAVRLYHDTDANGLVGAGDTLLAPEAVFAADRLNMPLTHTISEGATHHLLVTYDFGDLQSGETFSCCLAEDSLEVWGVSSSTRLIPDGLPMAGAQLSRAKAPTDPEEDADSDGMPDQWEMEQFGHLDQDEKTDYDGDGVNDLTEWQVGSDPFSQDGFVCVLAPHWNLASIPIVPEQGSPQIVYGENTLGNVWGWDGAGYFAMADLAPKMGYWVYGQLASGIESVAIPVRGLPPTNRNATLSPGWNLIGPLSDGVAPDSLKEAEAIWYWDVQKQSYTLLALAEPLLRGRGYWVYLNQEITLDWD